MFQSVLKPAERTGGDCGAVSGGERHLGCTGDSGQFVTRLRSQADRENSRAAAAGDAIVQASHFSVGFFPVVAGIQYYA